MKSGGSRITTVAWKGLGICCRERCSLTGPSFRDSARMMYDIPALTAKHEACLDEMAEHFESFFTKVNYAGLLPRQVKPSRSGRLRLPNTSGVIL